MKVVEEIPLKTEKQIHSMNSELGPWFLAILIWVVLQIFKSKVHESGRRNATENEKRIRCMNSLSGPWGRYIL